MNQAFNHIKDIFQAALNRVDPYRMIKEQLALKGDNLKFFSGKEKMEIDLKQYKQIFVFGAGKATAKMARAVEEILGNRITEGLISVKYGHTEELKRIKTIQAGHPVPDENSLKAAKEIENIAAGSDNKTLIINLISGGGSALLCYPLSFYDEEKKERISLTLKDMQTATDNLLRCGATIGEINCIRKHLSQIKGGRLARIFYPATSVNLILSDVVGDRLDTIASGLTAFDKTTYQEALAIMDKYRLQDTFPKTINQVMELGAMGKVPETPKKGDKVFSKVHNLLIGTNFQALKSAAEKAGSLKYNTLILSSQVQGEAKEVALVFSGIAFDILNHNTPIHKPACVLAGGETTVTIKGKGKGGRNQEMALAFLQALKLRYEREEGIYFFSGATDGNDGPTDAAGAFASFELVKESQKQGLDIMQFLTDNDSYNFYNRLGYLYKTGPTNTNVCDIQILIIN
jgi:glycerate 2-kinase